ncbi:MAG: sugar phosphate isomerase/epimerase, partial [Verrucomicrobiae bacterium]|nr:sugar phosphate isomerase/epimerase [Verrucomicrobiae bacterium]
MISNPIALSTCCNSHRHTNGYEMLEEIAGLGFEWTELSHGVRITLVPGIHKAIQEGVIKAISVHNFCPLPHGTQHPAPNLYEPASLDDRERKQWLKYSSRTIEFAAEVGAKYAVIHLGSVHFFWKGVADKVHKYQEKNHIKDAFGDGRYQKLLTKAMDKIRKKKERHMDILRRSIDELLPIAQEHDVILGFENREDLEELPMDEDMPKLLDEYADCDHVGYWYDPGHAQEKFDYGVMTPEDNLKLNGKHLAGVHFQDYTEEGKGHRALGEGLIDFDPIFPYLKPETPCILELTPSATAEGILASKEYLETKL